MYGKSRQNYIGSKGTKTLEAVGPKIGSRYRSSSNSQKSPATVQTTNHIVPYGGGHHSRKAADLSMALSYAFDNRGKLKRLDIASNSAMINMLQQIGRRSMQQSLDIQWQSTNQFPTLTHLHVDEIAKGAQKLNQILRACSSGINIDEGSIEIGKELWKGAKELEQSLRMLVSLQEASDNTVSQQRKSRLKLLDENGDSEDDSTVSSVKQKHVERPVFSFDRPSKNAKASVQTDLQKKLIALPYLEDSNFKSEKNNSMTSKSTPRRSASCVPDYQTSQQTTSTKSKHDAARLPNVIAKLMGLEELPQNINPKVATDSPFPQQRLRENLSIHTAQRSSKSADINTAYTKNAKIQISQDKVLSNNITILTTHKIELQEDTYRSTNSHKTTSELKKPRWNEEEREGSKDCVRESKAAIFKINELQSKVIQQNQDGGSQKDIRKKAKIRNMNPKQQEVADAMESLQIMVTPETKSLVAAETVHADTMGNSNTHEVPKTATSKPLIPQQKQNRGLQFQQVNMSYEPEGKNLKAENTSQQRAKNKAKLRKRDNNAEKLQNSRTVARDLKNMQKHLPIKQPNAGKKNEEDIGLVASKALLNNKQKEDPVIEDRFKNSDDKRKSPVSLRSDQNGPRADERSDSHTTEICANSSMDAKCAHDSARKVVSDIKPLKIRPMMKINENISKTSMTTRTIVRALRPQRPTSYRLKQNKLDKINVSKAAKEENESRLNSTGCIPGNLETRNSLIDEESQQKVDAEQTDTRNHNETSKKLSDVTTPTVDDGGENTIPIVIDDQQKKLVPEEVKVTLQITATDGQEDCRNNSCNQQQKQPKPTKMEKQEPLTEDELFLKQKLIKSHLFLNTAEALFKLNIPISILNYASDQIYEEKDSKIILDCGYELLKRRGRQDIFFYPSINIFMTCTKFRSLDDLVRQLHKDLEALRSYGSNGREYDHASCILNMLERDIYNRHPHLNCMWDLGWNELRFPCANMDEVISIIEHLMLEELVNELTNDWL